MHEGAMTAGTSYRTREAGTAAALDEAVARALRDTGTFDEPA